MWLASLRLRDFRNYARTDIAFPPRITLLAGANAQGKTNLLEAVYTVATGRSPRASTDLDLVRFGQDRAYVRAEVRGIRTDVLEVAVDRATGQKRIKIDGVPAQRSRLLGRLAVVLAGPLDDEVIRGTPAYRRRVMDAALSQSSPSYYFALGRYTRVVRQRNRLLAEGAARAALEPWDAQLVELGGMLCERRRAFVEALAGRAVERHGRLGGAGERLDVRYVAGTGAPRRGGGGTAAGLPAWDGVDEGGGRGDAPAAGEGEYKALARALAARREEEFRRGTSLVGPHRDDLEITVNGIDLRTFGSRGQQHTAALSLRLAEADLLQDTLGERPLLLLDDVLADLDPVRQERLLAEVTAPAAGDAQVLLTHTAQPLAAAVPMRRLMVRGGAVAEEHTIDSCS